MADEYVYTIASESELNELLAGREAGLAFRLMGGSPPNLTAGSTGVVWKRGRRPGDAQPMALVARADEFRRLCGRFAQLRSDLSPLTPWCHLLTPQLFESLGSLTRDPDLGGLEAAWTGLAVAEAVLLASIPLSNLRVSGCFATQSFAFARTKALWPTISPTEIIQRFDAANRLFRSDAAAQRGEARTNKVRFSLRPIWDSLDELGSTKLGGKRIEIQPLVASLRALREARADRDKDEARRFASPLVGFVPEAEAVMQLTDLTPELRLRLFDKIVALAGSQDEDQGNSARRIGLTFVAGYLATVAAGGAPSLTLAESNAAKLPEILAWAYVVGGIGERVVWTSGFDGLGRLVARELMRPLRLDEYPTCDFAFDEGSVLADPKLPDPLVRLRVKQAKIATVALFAGVNVSIPIADTVAREPNPELSRPNRPAEAPPGGTLNMLADSLWPFFRNRVAEYVESMQREEDEWRDPDSRRGRGKRKSTPQTQLPLSGSKR